jgi:hypothetical protein
MDKLDCLLRTFYFSRYLHIRLIIDELRQTLSKQWMVVHNDDSLLVDGHGDIGMEFSLPPSTLQYYPYKILFACTQVPEDERRDLD